ncbi:diguanylate cyclase/phosphodiesterase with PAS/PAC sensor(s) [Lachnospiraceae bacterium KM106-2]|nr:diguanylate cyclase/phosphodiesterase with PAS/PAC sensor(s) [Lachnospiraceae bacterium KM106-2]
MFCMGSSNSLLSQNMTHITEKSMLGFCFTLSILFLVIIFFLMLHLRKRKMAERLIRENKEELEENYKELECAYNIVTTTQKKLFKKYEDLKDSEDKNHKLAYQDLLTELPNRNALTEKLDGVLEDLEPEDSMAIMYIDVDDFKRINDTLGHSYGDELLIDITHRVKQALDEDDYFCRIGGDEFVVLSYNLKDIGLYEAKVKKIQTVFSYPFVLASKEFFVTVSIGICLIPKDGKTTQAILKNVDAAMYKAKELGKNIYCYYNDSINEKLMERIEMHSELRSAIERDEFVLHYQPQIDLRNGRLFGFEALLRWNHPTRGMLHPDKFIALAEETGVIVQIGRWVLLESCTQLKEWQDKGYQVKMSVNFSARQFMDADVIRMVQDVIHETSIDPTGLEIEVTEAIALRDIDFAVNTIQKIRDMGIQVSLDDFGIGYTSMKFLKLLPVNNLKIDKSFLYSLMEDASDQKIIAAIIGLAQALGLVVVAEGVENEEQVAFLTNAGCDIVQGYWYSKPIPKEEAEDYIQARK